MVRYFSNLFSCFDDTGCKFSSQIRFWRPGPPVSTSVTRRNPGLHLPSPGSTCRCHHVSLCWCSCHLHALLLHVLFPVIWQNFSFNPNPQQLAVTPASSLCDCRSSNEHRQKDAATHDELHFTEKLVFHSYSFNTWRLIVPTVLLFTLVFLQVYI